MTTRLSNFPYTATISASKTRPNDTTAYAAGDVLNESTSAGTNWTFTNTMSVSGGSALLTKVTIEDSANQSTKASLELWLFSTAPTADNDNAVFTPTDSENNSVIAIVPVTNVYVGDATSGAGGNCIYTSDQLAIPIRAASGSKDIYGVLVVRNAYTPVAQEVFRITLTVLQDNPS